MHIHILDEISVRIMMNVLNVNFPVHIQLTNYLKTEIILE